MPPEAAALTVTALVALTLWALTQVRRTTERLDPDPELPGRSVERARVRLNDAIDELTNLLLDIYPEDQDWDGDEIDGARSQLQEADEALAQRVKELKAQGADVNNE